MRRPPWIVVGRAPSCSRRLHAPRPSGARRRAGRPRCQASAQPSWPHTANRACQVVATWLPCVRPERRSPPARQLATSRRAPRNCSRRAGTECDTGAAREAREAWVARRAARACGGGCAAARAVSGCGQHALCELAGEGTEGRPLGAARRAVEDVGHDDLRTAVGASALEAGREARGEAGAAEARAPLPARGRRHTAPGSPRSAGARACPPWRRTRRGRWRRAP
eukprot:6270446-Prymnesium_polylepis.1